MADNSGIEWTSATWNPVVGCEIVSPGCTNCYAMKLAGGRMKNHHSRKGLTKPSKAGPVWNGEVRFMPEWLDQPLRWKRPRDIFTIAHGDLFYERVPLEWKAQVFAVIALAHWHRFQLLTKRAEAMRDLLVTAHFWNEVSEQIRKVGAATHASAAAIEAALERVDLRPLPNLFLGTSVEDAARAERVGFLLQTPAAGWWVSAEPLIGPVNFENIALGVGGTLNAFTGQASHLLGMKDKTLGKLGCIVVGGESKSGSRPMAPSWARSIRRQCERYACAFHFKQWGDWHEYGNTSDGMYGAAPGQRTTTMPDGSVMVRCGVDRAGRKLDGRTYDDRPGPNDGA